MAFCVGGTLCTTNKGGAVEELCPPMAAPGALSALVSGTLWLVLLQSQTSAGLGETRAVLASAECSWDCSGWWESLRNHPGAVSAEQMQLLGLALAGCSAEKWNLSGSSQPGDYRDKVHVICDAVLVCQLEHSKPPCSFLQFSFVIAHQYKRWS